jgi:hypothetical protein
MDIQAILQMLLAQKAGGQPGAPQDAMQELPPELIMALLGQGGGQPMPQGPPPQAEPMGMAQKLAMMRGGK